MNRKIFSLIVFLVLLIGTGPFVANMFISNVSTTYLPKDMPSRLLDEEIRPKFVADELMLIVFKDEMLNSKENFKKYEDLYHEIKKIKEVKKLTSLFNFEHIKANEDGFEVANILDLEEFDEFEKNLSRDKNVFDFLINRERNITAMVLEPIKLDSSVDRLALENKVNKAIEDSGVRDKFFGLGGAFVIDTAQFREMMSMMMKTIPLTILVGFLILIGLFGNLKIVILALVCNGVVTQFCLSLFTIIGWPYNMVSAMIPSLMMALNIAFMVHLLNAIKKFSPAQDAIELALSEVKKPSMYSAITTSIGLFALYTSPIPPIQHIGVIGGAGVLFSYFIVFEILPYILMFIKNRELKAFSLVDKFFKAIVAKTLAITKFHYGKICIVSAIVFMALIPPIYQVESESNLFKFFSDDHIVNIVNRDFQDHFVGTTTVDVIYKKENIPNLLDNKFLSYLYKAEKELETHPNITRAFSHADVVVELHKAFNNDSVETAIPDNNELIDQYTLIYDGNDMYDFYSRDGKYVRMNLAINVQGANEIEKVLDEVEKTLGKYPYKFEMTGQGKMMSDQENLLISGVLKSLALSLLVIFILLVVLWRSVADAIISMIPNISPILAGFSFMGILGIWLDFGTAMIASITVGIAVDDTIHVFHSIKSKLKNGMHIDQAIKETYEIAGNAIIMTTVILSSQFGLLCLSSFKPLMNFGFLTSIGLVFALIYDLLFLPAFIKFIVINKPVLIGLKNSEEQNVG